MSTITIRLPSDARQATVARHLAALADSLGCQLHARPTAGGTVYDLIPQYVPHNVRVLRTFHPDLPPTAA